MVLGNDSWLALLQKQSLKYWIMVACRIMHIAYFYTKKHEDDVYRYHMVVGG